MPDGRTFSAQLREDRWPQELELLLDGQPLPGSGTHPQERLKQAWYALLFLGILNIGMGLWTEFGQLTQLQQMGMGWGSVVEGALFVALGWLGYWRRSAVALACSLVLIILSGILLFAAVLMSNQAPSLGGIIMRAFICVVVFRAMKAARQLRAEESAAMME
ncbi:hypothetical protein I2I05_03990 [Hymenobacter sp. BT683]|uniref:Uncharacterized protein n=1 Tax=Hymenobacter jeongseonensis TaxID=2791027 RepID=A0ABS0IDV9_9BACT|nr:hypothetical protein [Hymenobacter jeongseonensis]MBF9236549.1 hypothetical protein [Hymenobacter jeongseonensis]